MKINKFFIFFLIIFSSLFSQETSIASVEQYQKEYNYPLALSLLQALVEKNPNDNNLYRLYGQIYLDLGRYSEALSNIQKSLLLSKSNPTNYLVQGSIYQIQKNFSEAQKSYNEALRLAPDFVEIYYRSALLNLEMGQIKEAERLSKLAHNFSPNSWQNYILSAQIAYRKNQLDQTQLIYFNAIEKFPYEESLFESFARFYIDTKQVDKAISVLKKANEDFGFSPIRAKTLGNILVKKMQYEEALSYFLQSDYLLESIDSKEASITKWRIFSLYQILKKPEEAVEYIQRAFQQDPSNQLYMASLYHLLIQEENTALPIKSEFSEYLEQIARKERKQGAGLYYTSILLKILNLSPDNVAIRNQLIDIVRLSHNQSQIQELLEINQLFQPNNNQLSNDLAFRDFLRKTERLDTTEIPQYPFNIRIYLSQYEPALGNAVKSELNQLKNLFPRLKNISVSDEDFNIASRELFQNNSNHNIVIHTTLLTDSPRIKFVIYDKNGVPFYNTEIAYRAEKFTTDWIIFLTKINQLLPNIGYLTKRLPNSSFEINLGTIQGIQNDQTLNLLNQDFQVISTLRVLSTTLYSSVVQLETVPSRSFDLGTSFITPIYNTNSDLISIEQIIQPFYLDSPRF